LGFHVIIPARYASTRLPAKPLLEIDGKPMLQHVVERAQESGAASVTVATDDSRIEQAVQGFGGTVCMTGEHHQSGTERLAEAAQKLGLADEDIVVNLQGDEPLMPPRLLRQVAHILEGDHGADMSTLCTRIHTAAELFDPHVVKVVMDRLGNALYFSRAVIPWDRDAFAVTTEELPEQAVHYRHLGLYAYRVGTPTGSASLKTMSRRPAVSWSGWSRWSSCGCCGTAGASMWPRRRRCRAPASIPSRIWSGCARYS